MMKQWKTNSQVIKVILRGLHRLAQDPRPEVDPALAGDNTILRQAIKRQNSIGWHKLVLGFLSSDFEFCATMPDPNPGPRRRHRRTRSAPPAVSLVPLAPIIRPPTDQPGQDPKTPHALDQLYSKTPRKRRHPPLSWSAKLISAIWNHFEEQWDLRNQDLHGHTPTESTAILRQRLFLEVDEIYEQASALSYADQPFLSRPIDDIKAMSNSSIQTWLHHVSNTINQCLLDYTELDHGQTVLTDFFIENSGVT